MARWTPVPVAGGAYSDDCLPWASQDTVNYIPVMAEKAGTRSPAMLRCLPGCTTFSVTGSDAPVRGMRNVEGRLLAVSGNALYRIGTDGAADSLGTIPGVARCSMAHNQISGGHEVAIANGQSGYIYNTATDTLAQITDEGFPGAKVFGFVDGFLMFIEPQGRFFGWSDLAAGTSYNTLDRSEAEAQPDRIVTGIESHGEWLVLGERSGEFYRNAGTTTGTFQRIPGTTMEVGCAGTHAVGKVDNSVIWVGHDGTVYRLSNGYSPQRVSTHAIEQQLSRCNLAQAFVTVFEDRGHKVVYITCPDGKTWGYDVATGEWHRRKSDGLDRWRMNTLVRWNGAWIAGDFSNGRLYQLDWAVQHEAGAEMERRRILPIAHDNQNRLTINAVEFVFDTGLTEASNPLPTPLLSVPLSVAGNLVGGETGEVVNYAYASAGGVLPRTFSLLSGALPAGLTMSTAGVVTGTRTTAAAYSWTVQVTDADGTVVTLADTSITATRDGTYWSATDRTNNIYNETVLTNGSRDATSHYKPSGSTGICAVRGHITRATADGGLYYFEIGLIARRAAFGPNHVLPGIVVMPYPPPGIAQRAYWGLSGTTNEDVCAFGTSSQDGGSAAVGARIGVLLNMATRKVWINRNGTWAFGVTPANAAGLLSATGAVGTYAPYMQVDQAAAADDATLRLYQYADELLYLPAGASPWADPL